MRISRQPDTNTDQRSFLNLLSKLRTRKISRVGERKSLASISCENQRQEDLLKPVALLGPKVFEVNAHAIRPDRSDHSRA